MKYVSAVKYLNRAPEGKCSADRMTVLCRALGRINSGYRFYSIYGNSIGCAAAELFGSVLSASGFRTAIIGRDTVSDFREFVTVDGILLPHAEFANLVLEVSRAAKTAANAFPGFGEFTRRELLLAVGMLAAKCNFCEFAAVILDGEADPVPVFENTDMCILPVAPCDTAEVRNMCRLIKKGVRETLVYVPGNVEYNIISDACAEVGCRLSQTAAATQIIEIISPNETVFGYRSKEGYSLRSMSAAVRIAGMLTIEAVNSMKRSGVKITPSAAVQGMAKVRFPLFCEKISSMPNIILDRAEKPSDIKMLADFVRDIENPSIAVPVTAADRCVGVFPADARIATVGEGGDFENTDLFAREYLSGADGESVLLCFGSPEFAGLMKQSIRRIFDGKGQ